MKPIFAGSLSQRFRRRLDAASGAAGANGGMPGSGHGYVLERGAAAASARHQSRFRRAPPHPTAAW